MSSGTDKIISSIMSEAQDKADKIIQDAQAEVDQINGDATKNAEAEKNKILENGKKQSDMRYQQIISEAKMNARRAELGAKEEVIEATFSKAFDELSQIASSGDEQYVRALANMVKEACIEIGGGDLIVKVKESDASTISSKFSSIINDIKSYTGVETTLTLGEPVDIIGGAIVTTANGDIEVNNTIESRLDRNKKILRSEVASVLFNL